MHWYKCFYSEWFRGHSAVDMSPNPNINDKSLFPDPFLSQNGGIGAAWGCFQSGFNSIPYSYVRMISLRCQEFRKFLTSDFLWCSFNLFDVYRLSYRCQQNTSILQMFIAYIGCDYIQSIWEFMNTPDQEVHTLLVSKGIKRYIIIGVNFVKIAPSLELSNTNLDL